MANPSVVSIDLESVEWTEHIEVTGGGGSQSPPAASPYMWTVFFKVDGETVQITDAATLDGSATLVFNPGSHGDLGIASTGVGQDIAIPGRVGQWTTVILPIPVAPKLQSLIGKTYPATFGVIVALLNHEDVTDAAAEAGHMALNAAVEDAFNTLLGEIKLGHEQITPDDIAAVSAGIPSKVHDAIEGAQSWSENLGTFFNGADSLIGYQTKIWTQDQFTSPSPPVQFTVEFGPSFNSWEVSGRTTAIDLCATTSVRIMVRRPEATRCTANMAVAGLDCILTARVGFYDDVPGRTFDYSWQVTGAQVSGASAAGPTLSVNVDDGAVQVTATVTVTDSYGCKIVQSQTFPVVTKELAGAMDTICVLRDRIQQQIVKLPPALQHPAGPDPSPEAFASELARLGEDLTSQARSLSQILGRA